MKRIAISTLVLLLAATLSDDCFSQRRQGRAPRRARLEKLEQLKQMRLIETLDLDEEQSVRFFAKQKEHQQTTRDLTERRSNSLDNLASLIDVTEKSAELEAEIAEILKTDQAIHRERRRYQDEMREFLSEATFAKLLLFEREFEDKVRRAVGEVTRRGRSRR